MQSIALYFGSTLKPITGHRAQRHTITAASAAALKQEVNSYHTLAIDQLGPDLVPLAHTPDGSIEAIRHQSLPIYGLMWHPEREKPLRQSDIQYIRQCFQAAP